MVKRALVRHATRPDEPSVRALALPDPTFEFHADQALVLEADGLVVGCGWVRPLPEGGSDLAFFDTLPSHRGRGLSRMLLAALIVNARRPLFTLTLPPVLSTYAGFAPIGTDDLPSSLQERARRLAAARLPWRAMRLLGTESALLRVPVDPDFPEW